MWRMNLVREVLSNEIGQKGLKTHETLCKIALCVCIVFWGLTTTKVNASKVNISKTDANKSII